MKRRRETSHADRLHQDPQVPPCLDTHALGPKPLELEATSDLPETGGRFWGKPRTPGEERLGRRGWPGLVQWAGWPVGREVRSSWELSGITSRHGEGLEMVQDGQTEARRAGRAGRAPGKQQLPYRAHQEGFPQHVRQCLGAWGPSSALPPGPGQEPGKEGGSGEAVPGGPRAEHVATSSWGCADPTLRHPPTAPAQPRPRA